MHFRKRAAGEAKSIFVREFPLRHKTMPTLYGHSSRILCVFFLQQYSTTTESFYLSDSLFQVDPYNNRLSVEAF
jgi:hypothetical protein